MAADLIVALASAACAVMLICMLQVEFRCSSRPFRYAVKALAACLLVSAAGPWLSRQPAEWLAVATHLALLAVLGLVRWRQLRSGGCSRK